MDAGGEAGSSSLSRYSASVSLPLLLLLIQSVSREAETGDGTPLAVEDNDVCLAEADVLLVEAVAFLAVRVVAPLCTVRLG